MTDREKFIQKKKGEIEKLTKQQIRLTIKAAKIGSKIHKTFPARMRNVGKLMVIMFQIKRLEVQKRLIASQPFPKFPKGSPSVGGLAIAGDRGKEEIILTPNHLQP